MLAGVVAAPVRIAAQDASPVASTESFTVDGAVNTPLTLTVADLQGLGLTAETVDVTFQAAGNSEDHSFTGMKLLDLVSAAGLPGDPDARNPLLLLYVVVSAKDGYQVVISGGELDPNFGNTDVLVAWEQDGLPLSGENGPVRIAVPGDLRGGRYVFGVVSIELLQVPPASAATPAA